MQEKTKKQDETIKELVLENQKMATELKNINSKNTLTNAMLEKQIETILKKQMKLNKEANISRNSATTRIVEVSKEPRVEIAEPPKTSKIVQRRIEMVEPKKQVAGSITMPIEESKKTAKNYFEDEENSMLFRRKKGKTQLLGLFNTEDDIY